MLPVLDVHVHHCEFSGHFHVGHCRLHSSRRRRCVASLGDPHGTHRDRARLWRRFEGQAPACRRQPLFGCLRRLSVRGSAAKCNRRRIDRFVLFRSRLCAAGHRCSDPAWCRLRLGLCRAHSALRSLAACSRSASRGHRRLPDIRGARLATDRPHTLRSRPAAPSTAGRRHASRRQRPAGVGRRQPIPPRAPPETPRPP